MIASMSAELPWLAVTILVGPTLSYFMIGLSAAPSVFFTHFLDLYLLCLAYVLIGLTLSSATPTFEVAQVWITV